MKIVIVGASSGIGREVAKLFLAQGHEVGLAARREEPLLELQKLWPRHVEVARLDVTSPDAAERLRMLFGQMGDVDVYLHVAGVGRQNRDLQPDVEEQTMLTNAVGFTRCIDFAFRYFSERAAGGHIAAISSIAGVRGLGVAPAYSATKAMQNTYLEALAQLARIRGLDIAVTDIRPGFVDTDLLSGTYRYPMLMSPRRVAEKVARAIMRRRRVVIIDWRYRVLVFFWRLVPHALWRRLRISN